MFKLKSAHALSEYRSKAVPVPWRSIGLGTGTTIGLTDRWQRTGKNGSHERSNGMSMGCLLGLC